MFIVRRKRETFALRSHLWKTRPISVRPQVHEIYINIDNCIAKDEKISW